VAEKDPGSSGAVPSYQDYLDRDSRPVPDTLRERSLRDLGTVPLDASRYTSQAFFDLEAERMWTRTWQLACREEELPAAGDTIVYDVVGRSLLVQEGLLAAATGRVQLGEYQEVRIRHFHQTLDCYRADSQPAV